MKALEAHNLTHWTKAGEVYILFHVRERNEDSLYCTIIYIYNWNMICYGACMYTVCVCMYIHVATFLHKQYRQLNQALMEVREAGLHSWHHRE